MRTLTIAFLAFPLWVSIAMANDIIFKDPNGKVLTKSDLLGYSGTATWEIKSERSVSKKALDYHNKGRQYGQQGDYEKSIEFLTKATETDTKWAYPVYDMAYTYMLMGNSEKAFELYKKVDSMSPRGFFTTKTAIYTLTGEAKGVFPKGLYMAYLSLEWMEPKKKSEAVLNLVNNLPNYAPAWKEVVTLSGSDEAALTAIENGLKANPDKETYGVLMVNKALIMHRNGKEKDAINILGQLALNKESSLATEKIAKQTLSNLLKNK